MKDNIDDLLTEYLAREESPSTELVMRVQGAIDKKERELIWKQICISSLFVLIFTALIYSFISIFLGSLTAKVMLIGGFAFSAIGSILFIFITKKELILEGGNL
ncbi:MAG TPA: hypothetical protein DGK91_13910 [Clostridium sp.]|nr:hypothetical protein [Clostridia bacterium]HCW05505.1 hypothetical protein [Clostridium sp.]